MPRHEETGKWVAAEYREHTTDHIPDDVSDRTLRNYDALEVTYRTSHGTRKTIRGSEPRNPGHMQEDDVEGVVFGHGSETYVITPDRELRTAPYKNSGRQLAEPGGIHEITGIDFPEPAPMEGAVQEDVEATIYYRSNYSDEIQSVRINVEYVEGHAANARLTGEEVDGDRRIEAENGRDRVIKSLGYRERTLGKVVRVDFPKGHEWTVRVRDLNDERAEWIRNNDIMEKKLNSIVSTDRLQNEQEVEVEYNGRIGEKDE